MASVKLSRDLRQDILKNVKAPYTQRIADTKSAALKYQLDADTWRDIIAQAACREFGGLTPEQVHALPRGWLPTAENLTIKRINDYSLDYEHQISLRCTPPIRLPAKWVGSYGTPTLPNLDDARLTPLAEAIRRSKERVNTIAKECDDVSNAIGKLLNQCSTLKQALDAYPALEKWVPNYAMEQHRMPSERKAQAKARREKVDLSVITQALLRQRVEET